MQHSTLVTWVSFFASAGAGAAQVIWPETIIPVVVFWIGIAGLFVSIVWYLYGNYYININLFPGNILLPEAAKKVYTKTQAADVMDMGGAEGRVQYHIDALLDEASREKRFHIYGKRSPSNKYMEIPRESLRSLHYNLSDNSLYRGADNEVLEYEELCIDRRDLKDHIQRWKEMIEEYKKEGGKLVQ